VNREGAKAVGDRRAGGTARGVAGAEHEVVDEQLRPPTEQVGERRRALVGLEPVVLVDPDTGQLLPLPGQFVAFPWRVLSYPFSLLVHVVPGIDEGAAAKGDPEPVPFDEAGAGPARPDAWRPAAG